MSRTIQLMHMGGATILQCDSAEGALDILSTTRVDLLIADIAMPHIDGNELIRRARILKRLENAACGDAVTRSGDV